MRNKNKDQPVVVDNGKLVIDSIKQQSFLKDEKAKSDSAALSKQVDSITKIYKQAKADLGTERKKVLSLASAVDAARLLNDTSSYFEYCNSLSATVRIQDERIQDYENEVEALKEKNDSINALMSSRVTQWRNASASLMQQAYKQTNTIDSLALKYNSLLNKAKKRYTVGIGACGGITNFGFGGSVGVVVCRKLFTF